MTIHATCFRAMREIKGLFPVLDSCDASDGEKRSMKLALSSVVYDLMDKVVSKIDDQHPSMNLEVMKGEPE